jgi:hypothetical protein
MPTDHIRYDILVQQALRGVVRDVMAETAKRGLAGEHHFFITFDTKAEGVRLSDRLREQYPEEMTIVLQYQFWDLKVTDRAFEVGLSFGGVLERLVVPLAAIKGFADPSVQFGLQFETLADKQVSEEETAVGADAAGRTPGEKAQTPARPRRSKASVPASPLPTSGNLPTPAAPERPPQDSRQPVGDKSGAQVVRLDRFRKK